MENSFFEYRNKTGVDSESDGEIIDNSLVVDDSIDKKKKNHTVFVAESEESATDDESQSDEDNTKQSSKSARPSKLSDKLELSRSYSGESKTRKRRQSKSSHNEIVLSSSDEDEPQASPELVPRRPPSLKKPVFHTPLLNNKNKKRMLFDSDLDNSIVAEHDKNKKLTCLKSTPLKIDTERRISSDQNDEEMAQVNLINSDEADGSEVYSNNDNKDDESSDDDMPLSNLQKDNSITNNAKELNTTDNNEISTPSKTAADVIRYSTDKNSDDNEGDEEEKTSSDERESPINRNAIIDSEDELILKSAKKKTRKVISSDESDGDEIDEDQMVMSRATRMSIMGVIPKGDDSDESDFIQSDDSHRKSSNSGSCSSLPDVGMSIRETPNTPDETPTRIRDTPTKTHETPTNTVEVDGDTSKLTCSPFSSPLHDITNEIEDSTENTPKSSKEAVIEARPVTDSLKNKLLNKLTTSKAMESKENVVVYDDDVTIIDKEPEIIALSSDDDDEVSIVPKSPKVKKSPKPKYEDVSPKKKKDNTIKSYLVPPSYPNQGVVYVKKHVRENELSKLNSLKEDLHNVRNLLEQIDINTLPDGGVKYIERLTGLEAEVRRQGDKVANMIVEPDNPTAEDIANDGFEKGLTWDEIQKASNAVQPRMFGKQAMSTHMAERSLILERLRDLHESLGSRPPESALAPAPRGLATTLMPHQLHALAWLRWRETQRPTAGILADDMGLGKTITMISLILSDKENNIDDGDSDDERPGKGSKLHAGGTLVVCPASLMSQWAGEVSRHCAPHALRVLLHHGPARPTQPQRLAGQDLVVTTYNILQRDAEKNGVLMRLRWRRVILDEAHIVRNHKSATSLAVSALAARRRWCLTGTPVQNKDLDLFALIKFLRCSPFDDLTMWKKWIDNKSLGGQERLSTIMRCLLLRRTKQQLQQRGQLACLPDRTPHQVQVTLHKQEMNVYQKVLVFSKTLFAQFLHQRAEKNSDGLTVVRPDKDSEYTKMHKKMIALQGAKPVKSHEILVLLLRLRQVCCHCGLIAAMLDEESAGDVAEDPAGQDLLAELNKLSLEDSSRRRSGGRKHEEAEEDNEPEEGTTAAEAIRSVLSPNNPVFELTRPSSKIQAVMDCLNKNVFPNKGDKAVVVSQWTSVLRLVERELARGGVRCVTLSGAVPVPARPPLILALNDPRSDVRVMLLSLCAGGVGLNLCGANHLLLLDPHWNPQLEEQAQDRIYRVGQTKHVHIYRFMCVDTVEQTIRKLQQAKLELAENVLTGARHTNASKLTIEDLKMLFNMGSQ